MNHTIRRQDKRRKRSTQQINARSSGRGYSRQPQQLLVNPLIAALFRCFSSALFALVRYLRPSKSPPLLWLALPSLTLPSPPVPFPFQLDPVLAQGAGVALEDAFFLAQHVKGINASATAAAVAAADRPEAVGTAGGGRAAAGGEEALGKALARYDAGRLERWGALNEVVKRAISMRQDCGWWWWLRRKERDVGQREGGLRAKACLRAV